jgi:hypothetical protein
MFAGWSFSEVRSLALLNFAVQWVMWACSSYIQSEKYYDITGKSHQKSPLCPKTINVKTEKKLAK